MDLQTIKAIGKRPTKRNFIITSYTLGSEVNQTFFNSLKVFCKERSADLLIIPLKDKKNDQIDDILRGEIFILNDLRLNDEIIVSSIAFNKKPTFNSTGTGRLGHESVIMGGSLQDISYIANGKNRLAKGRFITGSINNPNYLNVVMNDKSSVLSDIDHKLGAIIIEIEDNRHFHTRPIQFIKDGFIDLGVKYTAKKCIKFAPLAVVLGDIHVGETDRNLIDSLSALSIKMGVSKWILHDTFSGLAINHHEQFNSTKRAIKAENGQLTLKRELDEYAYELEQFIVKYKKEIVIVKSNHDEFLERYLNEMRYKDEPQNLKTSLELHLKLIQGLDPLRDYVESKFTSKKITWLKRDQEYQIAGIECGSHGDRGSNGMKRSSPQTLENAFLKSITGHTHTPRLFREIVIVGTSTLPHPDYGDGPTSWVQTSCIVNKDGSRQLINFINGKFTTFKK